VVERDLARRKVLKSPREPIESIEKEVKIVINTIKNESAGERWNCDIIVKKRRKCLKLKKTD